jgi:hypothetical protein
MIGMYGPRLLDVDLWFRLLLVVAAAVALVAHLRRRQGTAVAIFSVLGGSIIAVVPGIMRCLSRDLRGFGDMCRAWNGVDLPDGFFAVYRYFDIGPGIGISLLGMVCGSLLLLGAGFFVRKLSQPDGRKGVAHIDNRDVGASVDDS